MIGAIDSTHTSVVQRRQRPCLSTSWWNDRAQGQALFRFVAFLNGFQTAFCLPKNTLHSSWCLNSIRKMFQNWLTENILYVGTLQETSLFEQPDFEGRFWVNFNDVVSSAFCPKLENALWFSPVQLKRNLCTVHDCRLCSAAAVYGLCALHCSLCQCYGIVFIYLGHHSSLHRTKLKTNDLSKF